AGRRRHAHRAGHRQQQPPRRERGDAAGDAPGDLRHAVHQPGDQPQPDARVRPDRAAAVPRRAGDRAAARGGVAVLIASFSQGAPMTLFRLTAAFAAVLALAGFGRAADDVKVELKGTHLCCPACVKAAGDILKKVDGVTGKCDQKAGTITITAKDADAAKKALQALSDGGFHGDTGNKDLAIKDDSGVEKGKVKTLSLTGVHDCCGRCNEKIKAALKKVDGVKADTSKAKSDSFDVTGEFEAADVVKALNDAG